MDKESIMSYMLEQANIILPQGYTAELIEGHLNYKTEIESYVVIRDAESNYKGSINYGYNDPRRGNVIEFNSPIGGETRIECNNFEDLKKNVRWFLLVWLRLK